MSRSKRPASRSTSKLFTINPKADEANEAIRKGLRCACGARASFGEGVRIRDGQLGQWKCFECWKAAQS